MAVHALRSNAQRQEQICSPAPSFLQTSSTLQKFPVSPPFADLRGAPHDHTFFWCPRDGCGCTGAGFRLMTPDNAYTFGQNEAKAGQPSKRDAFSTSPFGTVRKESRKNKTLKIKNFKQPSVLHLTFRQKVTATEVCRSFKALEHQF